MFRCAANVLEGPVPSATFLQLVRWRRKPRWLPVAKSKLFRVPERKVEDPMERAELMRLHANYKTQLRAVRGFLAASRTREPNPLLALAQGPAEQMEKQFRQCLQINDEWNAEVAVNRNRRLEEERNAYKELIGQRLEAKEERSANKRQLAEERVRVEKSRSATLITPDNIEQAIEAALANVKDYDSAIDLSGRTYSGGGSQ